MARSLQSVNNTLVHRVLIDGKQLLASQIASKISQEGIEVIRSEGSLALELTAHSPDLLVICDEIIPERKILSLGQSDLVRAQRLAIVTHATSSKFANACQRANIPLIVDNAASPIAPEKLMNAIAKISSSPRGTVSDLISELGEESRPKHLGDTHEFAPLNRQRKVPILGRRNSNRDLRGVRIVTIFEDETQGSTIAEMLNDHNATCVSLTPERIDLEELRAFVPQVILVSQDAVQKESFVHRLRDDAIVRWASILQVEIDKLIAAAEEGINEVISLIQPLVAHDRRIAESVPTGTPVRVQVEFLGPTRLLLALEDVRGVRNLNVETDTGNFAISVADGMLMGIKSKGSVPKEGYAALADYLRITSGRAEIESSDSPSQSNVIAKLGEALDTSVRTATVAHFSLPPSARDPFFRTERANPSSSVSVHPLETLDLEPLTDEEMKALEPSKAPTDLIPGGFSSTPSPAVAPSKDSLSDDAPEAPTIPPRSSQTLTFGSAGIPPLSVEKKTPPAPDLATRTEVEMEPASTDKLGLSPQITDPSPPIPQEDELSETADTTRSNIDPEFDEKLQGKSSAVDRNSDSAMLDGSDEGLDHGLEGSAADEQNASASTATPHEKADESKTNIAPVSVETQVIEDRSGSMWVWAAIFALIAIAAAIFLFTRIVNTEPDVVAKTDGVPSETSNPKESTKGRAATTATEPGRNTAQEEVDAGEPAKDIDASLNALSLQEAGTEGGLDGGADPMDSGTDSGEQKATDETEQVAESGSEESGPNTETAAGGFQLKGDTSRRAATEGFRAMRRGELALAEAQFRRGLELEERHSASLHGLAETLIKAKRYKEAAEYAQIAVDKRPRRAIYHAILGDALRLSGKKEAAKEAYRNALKEEEGFDRAKKGLLKL